jgi:hypothetical protein
MGWNSVYRIVKSTDPTFYWPPDWLGYKHFGTEEIVIPTNHFGDEYQPIYCRKPSWNFFDLCFREKFLRVHSRPFSIAKFHLNYMGVEMGSSFCKKYA